MLSACIRLAPSGMRRLSASDRSRPSKSLPAVVRVNYERVGRFASAVPEVTAPRRRRSASATKASLGRAAAGVRLRAIGPGRLCEGVQPWSQHFFDVLGASWADQHSEWVRVVARPERNSSATEPIASRSASGSGPWESSDLDAEGMTRSGQEAKTRATSSAVAPCAPTPGAR
jgi:hypothetical protein